MDEKNNKKFIWKEIYFPPINLWNAPKKDKKVVDKPNK